jgi:hypothetical protein
MSNLWNIFVSIKISFQGEYPFFVGFNEINPVNKFHYSYFAFDTYFIFLTIFLLLSIQGYTYDITIKHITLITNI